MNDLEAKDIKISGFWDFRKIGSILNLELASLLLSEVRIANS
jgi:hypothetical protein